MPRPFLTAQWRWLAMLNYEIDPATLRPLLPEGLELDFHNGRTFVSVVGFRFLNTRLLGVPVPFHRHFDEVNLRFYVRRLGPEGWRRGVMFVKEIVPRFAIAAVARWVYNENYVALPMRSKIVLPSGENGQTGEVEYGWSIAKTPQSIRATFAGEPAVPSVEAEESFIAEHYWGYALQRSGSALEYRVEHPPWRVWRTTSATLTCDVKLCYGDRFCESLSGVPTSAFVAEGSDVSVCPGDRLANGGGGVSAEL